MAGVPHMPHPPNVAAGDYRIFQIATLAHVTIALGTPRVALAIKVPWALD